MTDHATLAERLGPDVGRYRVARTHGALYAEPKQAKKRRRCDGHLNPERHWINVGDLIVWSSLPPHHPEVGNEGWWHHAFCIDCAPEEKR